MEEDGKEYENTVETEQLLALQSYYDYRADCLHAPAHAAVVD